MASSGSGGFSGSQALAVLLWFDPATPSAVEILVKGQLNTGIWVFFATGQPTLGQTTGVAMKPQWDDKEFNTPEEMLVRTTFLVCVGGYTAGVVLLLGGVAARDVRLVVVGAWLLVIATIARAWLRRRERSEPAGSTWAEAADSRSTADAERVAALVQLLEKWDQLESKRGSRSFDPWALQAVRHDIRVMVETDPALEGLFHDSRKAA